MTFRVKSDQKRRGVIVQASGPFFALAAAEMRRYLEPCFSTNCTQQKFSWGFRYGSRDSREYVDVTELSHGR